MSTGHYHSSDSGCLTAIPALFLGKREEGQAVLEPRAGWWRCDRLTSPDGDLAGAEHGDMSYYHAPNGYLVHEHGGAFMAHEPRDKCGFPGGAE